MKHRQSVTFRLIEIWSRRSTVERVVIATIHNARGRKVLHGRSRKDHIKIRSRELHRCKSLMIRESIRETERDRLGTPLRVLWESFLARYIVETLPRWFKRARNEGRARAHYPEHPPIRVNHPNPDPRTRSSRRFLPWGRKSRRTLLPISITRRTLLTAEANFNKWKGDPEAQDRERRKARWERKRMRRNGCSG